MKNFVRLVRESSYLFRKLLAPIILGAVVFAAAMLIVQGLHMQNNNLILRREVLSMGMLEGTFDELNERMKNGDEGAYEEFLAELQKATTTLEGMTEEERIEYVGNRSNEIIIALAPLFILYTLIAFLVGVLVRTYYYALSLGLKSESFDAFKFALKNFVSMTLLSFWIILRSFIWIPVIGIIPAIILLPRFAFSCVIFLGSKKGIRESVRESHAKTRGKWNRVFLSYVALFVSLWIVASVIGIALSLAGAISGIIMALVWQFVVAFIVIFTTVFASNLKIS